MTVEQIAEVCHSVNRAYCIALGDNSQPEWNEAPDWQKSSAINGVNYHLDNPNADPRSSHEKWMEQKTTEGWKYGEVKDPEKKEHPCYLPYDQLPTEDKAKDYLFRQVVHSLKRFIAVGV